MLPLLVILVILVSGCTQKGGSSTQSPQSTAASTATPAAAAPLSLDRCVNQTRDDLKTRFNLSGDFNPYSRGSRVFYCESDIGYLQYWVQGWDSNNQSFSAYHLEAGTAASGADSLNDDCLFIDEKKIVSERLVGKDQKMEESKCSFDYTVFTNPTSAVKWKPLK